MCDVAARVREKVGEGSVVLLGMAIQVSVKGIGIVKCLLRQCVQKFGPESWFFSDGDKHKEYLSLLSYILINI